VLFFRSSDEISFASFFLSFILMSFFFFSSRESFFVRLSFHEAITAENFLKRRKVINLFIRVYPTLLPRTVIIQTHRRTIKTVSLFAV